MDKKELNILASLKEVQGRETLLQEKELQISMLEKDISNKK